MFKNLIFFLLVGCNVFAVNTAKISAKMDVLIQDGEHGDRFTITSEGNAVLNGAEIAAQSTFTFDQDADEFPIPAWDPSGKVFSEWENEETEEERGCIQIDVKVDSDHHPLVADFIEFSAIPMMCELEEDEEDEQLFIEYDSVSIAIQGEGPMERSDDGEFIVGHRVIELDSGMIPFKPTGDTVGGAVHYRALEAVLYGDDGEFGRWTGQILDTAKMHKDDEWNGSSAERQYRIVLTVFAKDKTTALRSMTYTGTVKGLFGE